MSCMIPPFHTCTSSWIASSRRENSVKLVACIAWCNRARYGGGGIPCACGPPGREGARAGRCPTDRPGPCGPGVGCRRRPPSPRCTRGAGDQQRPVPPRKRDARLLGLEGEFEVVQVSPVPGEEQAIVVMAPVEWLAVPAGEVPEAAVVVERHRLLERRAEVSQLPRCELRQAPTDVQRRQRRRAGSLHLQRHRREVFYPRTATVKWAVYSPKGPMPGDEPGPGKRDCGAVGLGVMSAH